MDLCVIDIIHQFLFFIFTTYVAIAKAKTAGISGDGEVATVEVSDNFTLTWISRVVVLTLPAKSYTVNMIEYVPVPLVRYK